MGKDSNWQHQIISQVTELLILSINVKETNLGNT